MTELSNIPIFDIDTHFAEQPDLWTSRAPAKYKDQVFHVQRKANGTDGWFFENREIAMIGPSVVSPDMTKHFNAFTLPTYDEMHRGSTYAKERLEIMDSLGVATQIVYPNVIGFGAQTMMQVSEDVALRQWHVEAYNDALAEMQQEGQGRLNPQAALPLWDMDASLKELERIRKLGLTGIVMSDKPADFGMPSLGHPDWDRFFATCQDLALPVNFHIGSGSFEGELNKWWDPSKVVVNDDASLNGPISIFSAVNNFMNNATDVLNLLLGGILEKFPTLKFVSVESGCGWLPFLIQAIQHNWKEMMSARDLKKFKRDPREMFIDQIFASYWFEDSNCVDSFIREFGSDNLMFQTDFPHPTSLYPDVSEKAQETLGHHSEETQRKVLYQNAERVYGVKVGQVRAH